MILTFWQIIGLMWSVALICWFSFRAGSFKQKRVQEQYLEFRRAMNEITAEHEKIIAEAIGGMVMETLCEATQKTKKK